MASKDKYPRPWTSEAFVGSDGLHYVHVKAGNGEIVARSNYGYSTEAKSEIVAYTAVFSELEAYVKPSKDGGYVAYAGDRTERKDKTFFYSEPLSDSSYAHEVAERLVEHLQG